MRASIVTLALVLSLLVTLSPAANAEVEGSKLSDKLKQSVTPKPIENDVVRGIVNVRNAMMQFVGRDGETTFRKKVRGVVADLFLRIINAADPNTNSSYTGPVATVLSGIGSVLEWTKQDLHLDVDDNSIESSERHTLAKQLDEAHTVVNNISAQLANGSVTMSKEVQQQLQEALNKITEVSQRLAQSNENMKQTVKVNLGDMSMNLLKQVKDILKDIITTGDQVDDSMDAISRITNTFGEMLTLKMKNGDSNKRFVKTVLLAMVRTQVPRIREYGTVLENFAKNLVPDPEDLNPHMMMFE